MDLFLLQRTGSISSSLKDLLIKLNYFKHGPINHKEKVFHVSRNEAAVALSRNASKNTMHLATSTSGIFLSNITRSNQEVTINFSSSEL